MVYTDGTILEYGMIMPPGKIRKGQRYMGKKSMIALAVIMALVLLGQVVVFTNLKEVNDMSQEVLGSKDVGLEFRSKINDNFTELYGNIPSRTTEPMSLFVGGLQRVDSITAINGTTITGQSGVFTAQLQVNDIIIINNWTSPVLRMVTGIADANNIYIDQELPSGLDFSSSTVNKPIAGNDSNDGLTLDTPLASLGAALAKVPKIVDHPVTITVYNATTTFETLDITFDGYEKVTILGCYGLEGDTLRIKGCNANIKVSDMIADISVGNCRGYIEIDRVRAPMGIAAENCRFVNIHDSDVCVEIADSAILATLGTRLLSMNNRAAGTVMTAGLQAQSGAEIIKSGTQPTGSEVADTGGIIR
jgi:hypothetical protein